MLVHRASESSSCPYNIGSNPHLAPYGLFYYHYEQPRIPTEGTGPSAMECSVISELERLKNTLMRTSNYDWALGHFLSIIFPLLSTHIYL